MHRRCEPEPVSPGFGCTRAGHLDQQCPWRLVGMIVHAPIIEKNHLAPGSLVTTIPARSNIRLGWPMWKGFKGGRGMAAWRCPGLNTRSLAL